MHSRGFPNCFIFSNVQSGFTVNFPHMIDEQARHCAYILEHAFANDVRVVEASDAAEQAWVDTIVRLAVNNQKFLEACTPGYYNEGSLVTAVCATAATATVRSSSSRCSTRWAAGTLDGLELTR